MVTPVWDNIHGDIRAGITSMVTQDGIASMVTPGWDNNLHEGGWALLPLLRGLLLVIPGGICSIAEESKESLAPLHCQVEMAFEAVLCPCLCPRGSQGPCLAELCSDLPWNSPAPSEAWLGHEVWLPRLGRGFGNFGNSWSSISGAPSQLCISRGSLPCHIHCG